MEGIDTDQLTDMANRRNLEIKTLKKWLAPNLR